MPEPRLRAPRGRRARRAGEELEERALADGGETDDAGLHRVEYQAAMIALAPFLGTLLLLQSSASPPSARPLLTAATPRDGPAPAPADPRPSPRPGARSSCSWSTTRPRCRPSIPTRSGWPPSRRCSRSCRASPTGSMLFGGRREIYVDDVSRYNNTASGPTSTSPSRRPASSSRSYPTGTEFRIVLLTDAIIDPGPEDWDDMDVPPGGGPQGATRSRACSPCSRS